MKYIITQEIVNAIIQYLASKPYSEVADGINALSNLQRYEESEVVEEPEKA